MSNQSALIVDSLHSSGGFIRLEVRDPGLRACMEHRPRACWPPAVPGSGHWRLRRQVGLGRAGGPPCRLAVRPGLRHRCPDRRRSEGRLRQAGLLEVIELAGALVL
jgi:hypothetical protein